MNDKLDDINSIIQEARKSVEQIEESTCRIQEIIDKPPSPESFRIRCGKRRKNDINPLVVKIWIGATIVIATIVLIGIGAYAYTVNVELKTSLTAITSQVEELHYAVQNGYSAPKGAGKRRNVAPPFDPTPENIAP